jgi:hypothetical protein
MDHFARVVVPLLRWDGADALVRNSWNVSALHCRLQLRKLEEYDISLRKAWMVTACFMYVGALRLNGRQDASVGGPSKALSQLRQAM